MKIIVMSDSHGIYSSVRKVINLQRDADLFVFLGDGEKDMLIASNRETDEVALYELIV